MAEITVGSEVEKKFPGYGVYQGTGESIDGDSCMVRGRCAEPEDPTTLTLAEAAQHPYLHEAGAVRWVDDDVLGKVLVPGMPIKFSETPGDAPLMTCLLYTSPSPRDS